MIADIDLPMLPPPSVPSERSVSVVVTLSSQSPHHHCHPSSQKPPLQDMSHLAMLQKIKTQLGWICNFALDFIFTNRLDTKSFHISQWPFSEKKSSTEPKTPLLSERPISIQRDIPCMCYLKWINFHTIRSRRLPGVGNWPKTLLLPKLQGRVGKKKHKHALCGKLNFT